MSDGADELETGIIFTAKTKNDVNVSIHSWFVEKLGATIGERMFKEFVTFTVDSAKTLPGVSGVLLDTRGGRVISIQLSN